jgi:hypothetical protein
MVTLVHGDHYRVFPQQAGPRCADVSPIDFFGYFAGRDEGTRQKPRQLCALFGLLQIVVVSLTDGWSARKK